MPEGMRSVAVYGESRGAPGLAGVGLIVRGIDGREIRRRTVFLGAATPSQAQFRAVIEGLKEAAELNDSVILVTTHDAVVRQLAGTTTAHAPEVTPLYAEAMELLRQSPQITIEEVDVAELEIEERLASIAIDFRGRRTALDPE